MAKNLLIIGYGGDVIDFFTKQIETFMGGSLSMAHGASIAMKRANTETKVVGVLGDSTFFHTGVESLIGAVYNQGSSVSIILDNRITGMGQCIEKAAEKLGRNLVIVASGDLSHKLKEEGPYGFNKNGPVFDTIVTGIMQNCKVGAITKVGE